MRIAIGSDHRGVDPRLDLKNKLESWGNTVLDQGTHSSESCDYPDIALKVAQAVSSGQADRGILICGTGIGMSIAANKRPGIRAAVCGDTTTAELSRRHNDANVLCLPADLMTKTLADDVVRTWLATGFEGGRHARRVKKISQLECREGQDP